MKNKMSDVLTMSDEDALARYLQFAAAMDESPEAYRVELARRETKRQTKWLIILTWVLVGLGLVNIAAVVVVAVVAG